MNVGVTMRRCVSEYGEERDCIAKDWFVYLRRLFGNEVMIVLLPNATNVTAEYLSSLDMDVVIFSGGNSIGDCVQRDLIEEEIWRFCRSRGIPMLGICRGLQFFHVLHGGELFLHTEANQRVHAGGEHKVLIGGVIRGVNSFHTYGLVRGEDMNGSIFARSEDGFVEAVDWDYCLGLMWHPERRDIAVDWEDALIKKWILDRI